MSEISSKYTQIWNELQKRIGINSPIPPVYYSMDFDYLYNKLSKKNLLHKIKNKLLHKKDRDYFEMKEILHIGGSLTLLRLELDKRLTKYLPIDPRKRYEVIIVEAGIIIPTNEEKEKKFFHECIHLLYYERSPELAIAMEYPAAFVKNNDQRLLLGDFFIFLNEAMTYFTSIMMSDIIKIEKNEAWKFFYDSMKKASPFSSKVVTSMLNTIYKENEKNNNFLDHLRVLKKYGPDLLDIYLSELGAKTTSEFRLRMIEKIISDLNFMKRNFEIKLYRMLYDGSLKPLILNLKSS
jgi:hypothetical protein